MDVRRPHTSIETQKEMVVMILGVLKKSKYHRILEINTKVLNKLPYGVLSVSQGCSGTESTIISRPRMDL